MAVEASAKRVLIVDDDPGFASALRRRVQRRGLDCEVVSDGSQVEARLRGANFDLMVLDLQMSPVDGWEVLERLPQRPPTVVFSGYLDVATTVRAMKAGVVDVMEKTADPAVVMERIEALTRASDCYGDDGEPLGGLLGASAAMRTLRRQVASVTRFRDIAVLIYGETGTGKELIARAIHDSGGATGPFVSVNCAAVPESLFESELFGHEAGAYTGARGTRRGLLEEAANGTLFLDEVGEMPSALQPKLLRVLEAKTFRRVGSSEQIAFRARVVSATNAPLPPAPGATLRADLYYRLNGFTVITPPLRTRLDDVPVLAEHFARVFAERYPEAPLRVSDTALQVLLGYDWPGNVRELRTVVEQAAMVADGAEIGARAVRLALEGRSKSGEHQFTSSVPPGFREREPKSLPDLERTLIVQAFEASGGNMSRAARRLGIPRTTLRDKLKRLGVI